MTRSAFDDLVDDYADQPRPLGAYAGLVGIFNAVFAGVLLLVKRSGRRVPERITLQDLLLLGVATHKLSRLLSKDWVTSSLRAPFTEYKGPSKIMAEVNESPRGSGWRYAIGQLVT